jgi:hypothetical protein
MSKTWKEMTVEEKLEALRADIQMAFQNLNGLHSRDDGLSQGISELAGQIQDLRRKVEGK